MAVVQIEVAGTDVTDRSLFSSARFMSQVNAQPGDFYLRLRDPDRTLAFPTGSVVILRVDGDVVWRGFMFQWKRVFVFPAVDVDAFGETRFFDMTGADMNVLFDKRIVFNQADPDVVAGKLYGPNTPDDEVIADLVADYLDLSSDTIDTSTFVDNVGDINEDQDARAWSGGDSWGQAMGSIAMLPAAIYYLRGTEAGADLVYCDVDTPNAPYAMSDQPSAGGGGGSTTDTDPFNRIVAPNEDGWGTGNLGEWTEDGGNGTYEVDGTDATATRDDSISFNMRLPEISGPAASSDTWSITLDFTWQEGFGSTTVFQFYDQATNGGEWGVYAEVRREDPGTLLVGWFDAVNGDENVIEIATGTGTDRAVATLFYNRLTKEVTATYSDDFGASGEVSITSLADESGSSFFELSNQSGGDAVFIAHEATFEYATSGGSGVGYRDMEILQDGTGLVNDQLAWGMGFGSQLPVFVRDQDAASQALHGLWQAGTVRYGIYKQATIDRVAASIVDGSPQSKRGSKDDKVAVMLTTYVPGFLPSQKIDFTSEVFDFNDVIPIRKMEVTFESPDNPRYGLVLSHEIDAPFGFFDNYLPNFTFPPFPPFPSFPPFTTGDPPGEFVACALYSSLADGFDRIVTPFGWGTASNGMDWTVGVIDDGVPTVQFVGIIDLTTDSFTVSAVLPNPTDTPVTADVDIIFPAVLSTWEPDTPGIGAGSLLTRIELSGWRGFVEITKDGDGTYIAQVSLFLTGSTGSSDLFDTGLTEPPDASGHYRLHVDGFNTYFQSPLGSVFATDFSEPADIAALPDPQEITEIEMLVGQTSVGGSWPEANKHYTFDNLMITGNCVAVAPASIVTDPSGFGCEQLVRIDSTHYQASSSMVSGSSRIFVNNYLQRRGVEYTEDTPASGTFEFTDPLLESDLVIACYYSAGPIGGGT